MCKGFNELEELPDLPKSFTAKVDFFRFQVAEPGRGLEILYTGRVNRHDPAAGGIHGHQVLTHDDDPRVPGSSLYGTVALHADNAVHYGKITSKYAIELDDRPVNAAIVQRVLGSAVNSTRNQAEVVLHGKGGAGPVVGFQLGHGHDEVGLKGRLGEKDALVILEETGDRRDVVAIQVDESLLEVFDRGKVAGFLGERKGVPAVAGTFPDDDFGSAQAPEHFESRLDQDRIGVDAGVGVEFHQVGLEEDAFAADIETALVGAVSEDGEQIGGVGWRLQDRDG